MLSCLCLPLVIALSWHQTAAHPTTHQAPIAHHRPLSAPAHRNDIVDFLWSSIETKHVVRHANRTTVIDTPSYVDIGPDPQKDTKFTAHTLTAGRVHQLHFPKDPPCAHGVSLSAAQSEGAVKADGRGPSLWDSWAHRRRSGNESSQDDSDTAAAAYDVATNFRYMYPVDVARARAMGMKTFAFSVSWSRVLPLGTGDVSTDGLQFYKDLVGEIKRQGMQPIVSLFHDDLPLALQRQFGGLASERFVGAYVDYAALMFNTLGKLGVKTWYTFNEPQTLCMTRLPAMVRAAAEHVSGSKVVVDDASLPWKCAGHIIQAHGRAFELFESLRSNGTIAKAAKLSFQNAGTRGVVFRDGSQHDKEARERYNDFTFSLFAEPIHKTGQYPSVVRDEVPAAWLPEFDKQSRKRIRHSADFIATNFFSSRIIKATERDGGYQACVGNVSHIAWPTCTDDTTAMPDGQRLGEQADHRAGELYNTAGTLRAHLKWIYDEFPTHEIVISALGWPERDENEKHDINDVRADDGRQRYMRDHLAEMLLAVYKDGTPLRGVSFYQATDAIDWQAGRALRYGLQSIDYTSANLTRTYKGGYFFVKNFFALHG